MEPWQALSNLLSYQRYDTAQGMYVPDVAPADTGLFSDPAKLKQAEALWEQIKQGGGPNASSLYQQLAALADPGKLDTESVRQGTAFDAAKKAGEWNFDSPLYGMALIAGAGALGGAFSGLGAGGGAAGGTGASGSAGIDTILGGAENFGTLPGVGGGSAAETMGAVGAGAAGGVDAATKASVISKIWNGTATADDYLKLLGPAMSIGSGVLGIKKAGDLEDAASAAAKTANPWEASGGRSLADKQAQALMKDPTSLLNDPGYKARMMGVERGMAAQGYQGSGNTAVAAANASGDFYNQRLALLGGLAGAPGSPVSSAQLNLAGTQAANNLFGQSLASIGYGVTQATGGTTTMPAAVKEWFRSQGMVI